MTRRAFVLVPLLAVDPRMRLPDGRRLADLEAAHADAATLRVLPRGVDGR